VLRVGVALHAEHDVSSALTALAGEHPGLVLDRSSAISERLLEEVRDGKIDAALGYPVPTMAASDGVESEVIRRIRNTVLVSEESPLAHRASLTVAELREETFLVNPRELAPGALQGLRTMCRVFGGFDPELLESTLPALPLEAAWRPIVEGSAILVLPETSAATVRAPGLVSVPIEPPPLCEVILAWGARSLSPMLERFIAFMRAFRNDHWQ
jgi:DNA-binding transcriptional LysR family regulator